MLKEINTKKSGNEVKNELVREIMARLLMWGILVLGVPDVTVSA